MTAHRFELPPPPLPTANANENVATRHENAATRDATRREYWVVYRGVAHVVRRHIAGNQWQTICRAADPERYSPVVEVDDDDIHDTPPEGVPACRHCPSQGTQDAAAFGGLAAARQALTRSTPVPRDRPATVMRYDPDEAPSSIIAAPPAVIVEAFRYTHGDTLGTAGDTPVVVLEWVMRDGHTDTMLLPANPIMRDCLLEVVDAIDQRLDTVG